MFVILAVAFLSGCSKDIIDAEKIEFDGSEIKTERKSTVEVEDKQVNIVVGGKYLFTGSGENIHIKVETIETVEIYLKNLIVNNMDESFINVKSKGIVNVFSIGENTNKIAVYGEEKKECIKSKGNISFSGDTLLSLEGQNCINSDIVYINANIQMTSLNDSIKADVINIDGGIININTESDCIDADVISISGGEVTMNGAGKEARGIYAGDSAVISGGTIRINTENDAIASNKDLRIAGGTIEISTKDDAIHADKSIQIDGGTIIIADCLEGIESADIYINGGDIEIYARNDGVNAAQSDKDSNKSANIYINGGTIKIDAEGDGLDANGSIYVDGGVLFVSGSADDKNNAIDFDADFVVKKGTVIAAGNIKDAKLPYDKGIQNSGFIRFNNTQSASKNIIIYDENNNAVLIADFPKAYNCIIISSDKLLDDKTYYVGTSAYRQIQNDYILEPDIIPSDTINIGEFTISSTISWTDIIG